MKIISHRGNLNGPNPQSENKLSQIELCLQKGYDVEIDLRYIASEKEFYLGHDTPDENVSLSWINDHKDRPWIHCKTLDTLDYFSRAQINSFIFGIKMIIIHLRVNHLIWAYPGMEISSQSIIVLPELDQSIDWNLIKLTSCYGICTDYPNKLN